MQIRLLEEAQRRFEAEDAWWRANRDAKDLFTDEVAAILGRVAEFPEIGRPYRVVGGRLIRRILLPRVKCHIYYHYNREMALIEVHSIWGARRQRRPRL